jgi:predicted alpha/beta superfamily hydrolase
MTTTKEKLVFELNTPVDDGRPVFLAGNFSEWYPDVPKFEMKRVEKGRFQLEFPADINIPDNFEYKYTRGGWNQVELDLNGNATPNRITRRRVGTRRDFVPHWRTDGRAFDEKMVPEVRLVSGEFDIPQLSRKRKVSVLLPYNYDKSTKRYPVLYLQDGQNLFGQGTSFGNWEIDKKMAILAAQGKADVIIVAIEHGGEDRKTEYNPYENQRLGKGEGRQYVKFLVDTLKPYIDSHYRTQPSRLHTGIGGSSMGGLISIYAGLMYPHIFGKLMVFSPSLWVSSKIYFDAIHFFEPLETKIYAYAGGKESTSMIPSMEKLKEAIDKQSFDNEKVKIKLSIDPKGKHSETRWGQEFPKALEWLYF